MVDDGSRTIAGGALNPGNQQIFTVEALRGLAARSVTRFHIANGYLLRLVRYSGFYGWLGVEMFFVISGFIIPYSLHRSQYKLAHFPRFFLRGVVSVVRPA